jgi:hypothetical protein
VTRAYSRTPGLSSNSGEFRFGARFAAVVDLTITGVWWYWITGGPTTVNGRLYVGGVLVASGTKASGWSAGWHLVAFDTPYALGAAGEASAVAHINDGNYGYDTGILPRDFDVATDGDLIEGLFAGGAGGEPGSTWTGLHGLDVEYSTGISQQLGIAAETDTARPLGRRKTRTLGIAAAVETALPLGRVKRRTLGIALESNTARPLRSGAPPAGRGTVTLARSAVITKPGLGEVGLR